MATLSTLRKGIEVMFLFTEAEPSLSLHEIASRLKLPRSTVYRFVHTLRDSGVLAQDPESRRYRLGSRLLDLQVAISRPVDLRTAAIPLMRELVALSDETAHLTERRGDLAVITEVVESPHILRMAPRRGQSFPLHAGALSRAILALLPPGRDRAHSARPATKALHAQFARLAGGACEGPQGCSGARLGPERPGGDPRCMRDFGAHRGPGRVGNRKSWHLGSDAPADRRAAGGLGRTRA